jgi:hypothetical protein
MESNTFLIVFDLTPYIVMISDGLTVAMVSSLVGSHPMDSPALHLHCDPWALIVKARRGRCIQTCKDSITVHLTRIAHLVCVGHIRRSTKLCLAKIHLYFSPRSKSLACDRRPCSGSRFAHRQRSFTHTWICYSPRRGGALPCTSKSSVTQVIGAWNYSILHIIGKLSQCMEPGALAPGSRIVRRGAMAQPFQTLSNIALSASAYCWNRVSLGFRVCIVYAQV